MKKDTPEPQKKKESSKRRLVLLDAHAILHRAYHALPEFTSSKGEPTGGLYGLSTMLLKIIADLKPDYVVACYDLPGPTYRHEAYEGYKAKRPKADDALISQMNRSRDIFTAFGVPMYEKAGFEADDMLGTIVEQVKKDKDLDVVIASGDMDTLQLVNNKKVRVYTLRKGIQDTIIYDEDGVVERFGFAPEFLPDFKGLRGDPSDNIIGVPGIGEKTASILIKNFGTIENMYRELKKDKKSFGGKSGISPRVIQLLEEYEEEALFSKMLASIRRDAPIEFALPQKRWSEAFELPKAVELFTDLGFRTLRERLKVQFGEKSEGKMTEEGVQEVPAEEEIKRVGIAVWLLDSNLTNPSLEDILQFAKTSSFSQARDKVLAQIKETELLKVYEEIELPLIPVVSNMEKRGIRVDIPYLEKLSVDYHRELDKREKEIYKLAGGEFNINSPRQLGEVLFEKLNLTVKNQKKTGTGQKSTRESELEKLRGSHPVVEEIFAHRELQKLLSTYIDNIPKMVDTEGRLHATFLQTGTTTGRMSSQNPNLQNIPIRTELGRNIRKAFVADEGFVLAAFDYSQIELRVAAFLSQDERLVEIFKNKGDVHSAVAAQVFSVPPELVDYEMRRRAKIINFGILYGMGVNALRESLGTTRAEAQQFYNEYFKNFSGLAHYLAQIKAQASRKGYTETYFGRRRTLEGISSLIPYVRAQAERMAINAPMQGTTADIMKLAMIRIDAQVGDRARLLLQVHDELVFEIEKGSEREVAGEVKRIMESILAPKETGGVSLDVVSSVGPNWDELKKLEL